MTIEQAFAFLFVGFAAGFTSYFFVRHFLLEWKHILADWKQQAAEIENVHIRKDFLKNDY